MHVKFIIITGQVSHFPAPPTFSHLIMIDSVHKSLEDIQNFHGRTKHHVKDSS